MANINAGPSGDQIRWNNDQVITPPRVPTETWRARIERGFIQLGEGIYSLIQRVGEFYTQRAVAARNDAPVVQEAGISPLQVVTSAIRALGILFDRR